MTTYTFQQDPSNEFVNWDDPTVWTNGQVPNSADADVVFPLVPIVGGFFNQSYVTIKNSEDFIARSVDAQGDVLAIDGSLSISGNLTLGYSGVTLEGTLSFGSLTSGESNGFYRIEGSGPITSPNSLTVTGTILGGETIIVPTLFNTGLLEAYSPTGVLTVDLTDPTAPSSFSGGILAGGTYEATQQGVLDLNVGAVITDISGVANITGTINTVNGLPTLGPGSEINSYDQTTGSYRPFQDTVTTIDPSGTLYLSQENYAASVPLTVEGTLELGGFFTCVSSPDLQVAAGGTIRGNGTVAGKFVNDGLIQSGIPILNEGMGGYYNLVIQNAVTGTGSMVIGSESSLELQGKVSQTVTFQDSSGRLYLDAPTKFTGSIALSGVPDPYEPFDHDTIEIADICYCDVTSYSYSGDSSGGVLTIMAGYSQDTFKFVGSFTTASFTLSDGSGPVEIVPLGIPPISPSYLQITIACFCPGTLIVTGDGEMPVERLAVGQDVITASGRRRPIRWIGQRSYSGRFLAANPAVHPVRIRAGALQGALPRRDLVLSPDHAVFLDGLLVPARCLVNGTTIVRERGLARVEYYHVELDSHDILLAEGAPSESFVDDDSRSMFHNVADWERLYPGRERVPAVFCAPRVDSGPELEAIRRKLARVEREVAQAA